MKLSMNLRNKRVIKSVVSGLAFLLITSLLAGCSHPDKSRWVVVKAKKQNIQQLRKQYLYRMQQDGIQIVKLGETFRIIIPSDDIFKPDSANLCANYRHVLDRVSNFIKTYDTQRVAVNAYTDSQEKAQRSNALTTRQAQVVEQYLWRHDIDTRLAAAQGYGHLNAVDWNGSAQGRASNRRVEITFRYYPPYVPFN